MAPFRQLFHFSLCLIPSTTASSYCPPFSRPAGNLLWPFQLKEALPANPISCDRCDGEGPIKARRAAVGSPIGAQTPLRFDSWLPLLLLRSPLVSLTLSALQRGRGNGCKVRLTPERGKREKGNIPGVVSVLANHPLVFCDCQQKKLIMLLKKKRKWQKGEKEKAFIHPLRHHVATWAALVLQQPGPILPSQRLEGTFWHPTLSS